MNEISTGAKIEGSAASSQSDRETMRSLIDKGVEYLMPLYVDVHGIAKTKTVPVSHFDRMMRGSELFTGAALDGLGQGPHDDELAVLPDPRATHSAADRKAQFDLSVKLSGMLGEMAAAVDRMNDIRLALDDRAGRLSAGDTLAPRLTRASSEVDDMRKKIVATKEGGMITGEERLRENLADLYGNVIYYDGRPSRAEFTRTGAIGREMTDISRTFDQWINRELGGINTALKSRRLDPIPVLVP